MLFETIKSVIKTLWSICRLKKGPEDLPNSPIVFAVLAIITALLSGPFSILVTMLFVWLILKYTNLESRFIQTASALFGATSILSCFAWLTVLLLNSIMLVFVSPLNTNNMISTNTALFISVCFFIVALIFLIWLWAISAHIYSRALNKSFAFGIFIAFIGFLFAIAIQMIVGGIFAVGYTGFLYGTNSLFHQPFMLNH